MSSLAEFFSQFLCKKDAPDGYSRNSLPVLPVPCQAGRVLSNRRTARYQCLARDCRRAFQLSSAYHAYTPGIKSQIVEMTMKGSGVRDMSQKYLPSDKHTISKHGAQRIERKPLTFRTRIKRLARKTMCFSKICQRHDIAMGLFINRYEFGLEGQV